MRRETNRDAAQILSTKYDLLRTLAHWVPSLYYRRLYIMAYGEGYFSLADLMTLLMFPASFEAKTTILRRKHNLRLFNHSFYGAAADAMSFIEQIVVLDQYHAKQYINRDSIVIDAGANIGTFAVLAANLAPAGRVYAFEPVAGTFRILATNAGGYDGISCVQVGLGDARNTKNILVKADGNGDSTFEGTEYFNKLQDTSGKLESAPVVPLDWFVREHKIPHVDFIKIDTEGYEGKILKGAAETIRKWKPVIAMSAYHNPTDKTDLPALLNSIAPYACELHRDAEEDLICTPVRI
jgi:FkbM family methyltransferase